MRKEGMAWVAKDDYDKSEDKKALHDDEKEIIRQWREKRLKQSYKKYEFNLYCCGLETLKSFLQNINFMVIFQLVIATAAVFICQTINISFDIPVHLIISPIVFPLAFAINTDFHRREKVLEDLAVFKSSGMVWYHCMREWRLGAGLDIDWLNSVRDVIKSLLFHLCEYLVTGKHQRRIVIIRTMYREFSRANMLIEKIRDSKLPTNSAIISRSVHLLYCMCLSFERLRVIREYRSPRAIRSLNKIFIVLLPIILAPYFVHERKHAWEPYYITLPVTFVFSALQSVQDKLDDPFDGMGEDDINLEDVDTWSLTTLEENSDRSFDVGRFKVSISSERIFMESVGIENMPDKEKLKSILTPILEGMSGQTKICNIKRNSNSYNEANQTLEIKIENGGEKTRRFAYVETEEDRRRSLSKDIFPINDIYMISENGGNDNDNNNNASFVDTGIGKNIDMSQIHNHAKNNHFENRSEQFISSDLYCDRDKKETSQIHNEELIDIRIDNSETSSNHENNLHSTSREKIISNHHIIPEQYCETKRELNPNYNPKKLSIFLPPDRKISAFKSLNGIDILQNYSDSNCDFKSPKKETVINILQDEENSTPLKRRCSSHSDISNITIDINEVDNFQRGYQRFKNNITDQNVVTNQSPRYLPMPLTEKYKNDVQLPKSKNGIFNLFENIKSKSKPNVYSSFVTTKDFINTIDVFPV